MEIPEGYCQCGCGKKTKLAPYSSKRIGWIKGKPIRFIHGHNAPFRGYVITEKTKQKISQSIKKLFKDPQNTPSWKGGIINKNGYIFIMDKGNPNSDKNGYVKRCVLIAQKILNRPLKSNELVHHINGIRNDDSYNNLLICTISYHKSLEAKIRWKKWREKNVRI
jgi:hypothetical protein